MSRPRIRIERIQAGETDPQGKPVPGIDGVVWYEVLRPDRDEVYFWTVQPFARGAPSGGKVGGRLVWNWESGPIEAPTLTPSFLSWAGDLRIHLYLKAGRIELLGDSTVELAPPAAG